MYDNKNPCKLRQSQCNLESKITSHSGSSRKTLILLSYTQHPQELDDIASWIDKGNVLFFRERNKLPKLSMSIYMMGKTNSTAKVGTFSCCKAHIHCI